MRRGCGVLEVFAGLGVAAVKRQEFPDEIELVRGISRSRSIANRPVDRRPIELDARVKIILECRTDRHQISVLRCAAAMGLFGKLIAKSRSPQIIAKERSVDAALG